MDARDFRTRVLAERARALASRPSAVRGASQGAPQAASPVRLVCLSGARHYALPIEAIESVQPFVCHATPFIGGRAARAMLGLAVIGGQVVSVLDLAGLLGPAARADAACGENSVLLAMRSGALSALPAVALGVERVLGAMTLQPADEPGHAVLPAGGDDPVPVLVRLVDETTLQRAIASLETVPRSVPDLAGA